eukprot:TRINITY_DN4874_c0_g1_i3.p1 TRINITY_DN4874_c0_g1~~TRINITY_DN4874_c0_g1_i3.p1  ORF type:complete len:1171 (-),score=313.30 TRINITY_DN4874_c0_g1_i3:15-3527(-)
MDVTYDISEFLQKNKDSIAEYLEDKMRGSSKDFVRALFVDMAMINQRTIRATSIRNVTVASQFKTQLANLLTAIELTEPHYVRCLAPNRHKLPDAIDSKYIEHQLRCSGVMQVVQLRRGGYPTRFTFDHFIDRYRMIIPSELTNKNSGGLQGVMDLFLKSNFKNLDAWQVGKTKIFLKAEAAAHLESIKDAILHNQVLALQNEIRNYHATSTLHHLKEAKHQEIRALREQEQLQLHLIHLKDRQDLALKETAEREALAKQSPPPLRRDLSARERELEEMKMIEQSLNSSGSINVSGQDIYAQVMPLPEPQPENLYGIPDLKKSEEVNIYGTVDLPLALKNVSSSSTESIHESAEISPRARAAPAKPPLPERPADLVPTLKPKSSRVVSPPSGASALPVPPPPATDLLSQAPTLSFFQDALTSLVNPLGPQTPPNSTLRPNPPPRQPPVSVASINTALLSSKGDKTPSPLHVAVSRNNLGQVKKVMGMKNSRDFLLSKDELDRTPLLMALLAGHPDVIESLLKYSAKFGVDLNQKDENGNSVLHLAAMSNASRNLIPLLRYKGLQVHQPNDKATTPLHYVCQKISAHDCVEIITLMLDKGALVNYQNESGETALHRATLNTSADVQIANVLIKRGAAVNIANKRNEIALHWAIRMNRYELVLLLLRSGSSLTTEAKDGTPYALALKSANSELKEAVVNYKEVGATVRPKTGVAPPSAPPPEALRPITQQEDLESLRNLYLHIPQNLLPEEKKVDNRDWFRKFLPNTNVRHLGFDPTSVQIPPLIEDTVSYLQDRGLETEGLFRVSGRAGDIKELKKVYDKGSRVDLRTNTDPHTIAGLMKAWLRELPQPIFTFEFYDAFKWAMVMKEEYRIYCLRKVLSRLPPGNKAILNRIFGLLHEVIGHADVNKMTATNLAIIFAPSLFKSKDEKDFLADQVDARLIIEAMILDYQFIFRTQQYTTSNLEEKDNLSGSGSSDARKMLRDQVKSMIPEYADPRDMPKAEDSYNNVQSPPPETTPLPDAPVSSAPPESPTVARPTLVRVASANVLPVSAPGVYGEVTHMPPLPSRMGDDKFWFYGKISRTDAEQLLISSRRNTLMVRSSSMEGCYAISTYDCSDRNHCFFVHYLVLPSPRGFKLEDPTVDGGEYSSLLNLIDLSPAFKKFEAVGKHLQKL